MKKVTDKNTLNKVLLVIAVIVTLSAFTKAVNPTQITVALGKYYPEHEIRMADPLNLVGEFADTIKITAFEKEVQTHKISGAASDSADPEDEILLESWMLDYNDEFWTKDSSEFETEVASSEMHY